MGCLCTSPFTSVTKKETISDCPVKGMKYTMNFIHTRFPSAKHTSTHHLWNEIQREQQITPQNRNSDRIIILDIRNKEEYKVSHILGAIWIKPSWNTAEVLHAIQNEMNIDLNSPNNCNVYCYCTIGYRSSKMAQQLVEDGIYNVSNIDGSIFQWINEGKPVVDNAGKEIKSVHTYNSTWAMLLSSNVFFE